MAVEQPVHRQDETQRKRSNLFAKLAFLATIIAPTTISFSVLLLLLQSGKMMIFGETGLPDLVTLPQSVTSSPLMFWVALTSGVLGLVFWAAMVRQNSANEIRAATMKLELDEMARRSEQRLNATNH